MLIKDYQTLLSTIIFLIGFIFAYGQINCMKKDRHSGLVMNLTAIWDSSSILESRKAIMEIENNNESLCKKLEEYEKKNPEMFLTLFGVGNYFEHMGWLVEKGYIDNSDLIIDTCRSSIIYYFKQYKEFTLKNRGKENEYLFEYFEKLANIALKPKYNRYQCFLLRIKYI